jgi:hypothetical protein
MFIDDVPTTMPADGGATTPMPATDEPTTETTPAEGEEAM